MFILTNTVSFLVFVTETLYVFCAVRSESLRYLVKLRREILLSRHATFISGITVQPISCQQYTNIVSPPVSQLPVKTLCTNLHNSLVQRHAAVSLPVGELQQ